MTTPRLHLQPRECPTCRAPTLHADLDAAQHIWFEPLILDPHLLTPKELTDEVLANNIIYRVFQTRLGHKVAFRHRYQESPEYLAARERGRLKYEKELGYARKHQHNSEPLTGPRIEITATDHDQDLQDRLETIRNAIEQHPHLEDTIRATYDPAPF